MHEHLLGLLFSQSCKLQTATELGLGNWDSLAGVGLAPHALLLAQWPETDWSRGEGTCIQGN